MQKDVVVIFYLNKNLNCIRKKKILFIIPVAMLLPALRKGKQKEKPHYPTRELRYEWNKHYSSGYLTEYYHSRRITSTLPWNRAR